MDDRQIYNYFEPFEVAAGIYWVGFYDEKANFHCNPYLLIDGDEAVVFDPGGVTDYPAVSSKIISLVNPSHITYIVLHHQDPDLCAGIAKFENMVSSRSLRIITHSRAACLIKYHGVRSEFYCVDKHGYELKLKSGRVLKFMVTPFCHFPAAFVTYDEKEKVLFSSDIFGAVSDKWHLFAQPGYEEQMRFFHVGYMASMRHLNAVLDKIERLHIKMVLPQHGSIIRENMIHPCIQFLKTLKCGIDAGADDAELYGWIPD